MVHSVNHAMLVHHGAPRVVEQKNQCCVIDDRVKFGWIECFVLHDLFFYGISFRLGGARFKNGTFTFEIAPPRRTQPERFATLLTSYP